MFSVASTSDAEPLYTLLNSLPIPLVLLPQIPVLEI